MASSPGVESHSLREGRVGPGPTAVARPPIGTGAHACMCACTRACTCTAACMLWHTIRERCMCGAYGSRHRSVCYCYHMPPHATVCYHMAHVMEAPRPSKAREVRNRWRRPRRCARRRARRRGKGHVPRIVRGPAVARQRPELGRHRSELRVRACEGCAAVARVPVPLRRPARCGVQLPSASAVPRTHTRGARTTAHARHMHRVCCGYGWRCSSTTAAGLCSRLSRHSTASYTRGTAPST